MIPIPIHTLGQIFSVVGWAIGIASVGVLGYSCFSLLQLRRPQPPADLEIGKNPDAIVLTLKVMTKTIGVASRAASAVSRVVFKIFAAAAACGLVLATLLYFTGNGLRADAMWARISAAILILLITGPLVFFAPSKRPVGRIAKLFSLVICAIGLHSIWANRLM